MKTRSTRPSVCSTPNPTISRLLACAVLGSAASAFAASQTWTNAPASALWNVPANWVGNAVPGDVNNTGNNNVNNDTATFNTPLFSGIGGAANPIVPDDATVVNGRSRRVGSIVFDGENVGAYVIDSPSPVVLRDAATPAQGILYVSHNGSIRLTESVANPQSIAMPMLVNLPSSTAGVYSLINNSTNPAATLSVESIEHNGANTRATRYVLDGVNTGNNVVTNLSEGPGNATGGITKQGSGTWLIAGTGLFPGGSPININEGILGVLVADAFGSAAAATVTNTGVLRLENVTLPQAVNLRKGGTLTARGSSGVNGVVVGNHVGTTATLATTMPSDVLNPAASGVGVVSGGAADSVLNTAGPGTVVLSMDNTYAGRWSFGAKINQITTPGALGTGPNANVAAGAVLDLTIMGGVAFMPTTTGFGGSGTGTAVGVNAAAVELDPSATLDLTGKAINLVYTPTSASGDLARPALHIAIGTLALSGNTFSVNNASLSPLGVGTYRLITQATGSILSGGNYAVLVSGSGLAAGTAAAIQVSGGNVDLVVTAYTPKNLVWSGGNPDTTWDLNSTANFLNSGLPSVFNNSDSVLFNATGVANSFVNLAGTLAPSSVTVDTTAGNYTFGGAGQIGGAASLAKVGTGTLVLQTANTYAGGTVISNGTIQYAAENALPSSGTGDVAIYGNGRLDLNGQNGMINGLIGNGSVDLGIAAASVLTVGNNDRAGTFSGVIGNSAGTLALTKIGTNSLTLSASNSYAGPTTVQNGILVAASTRALGVGELAANGGIVDVAVEKLIVSGLSGAAGTVVNNSTGTNTLVLDGSAATTFGGTIMDGATGGMALQVLGGSLRLNGNNTFTGGTVLAAGTTLQIGNSPANLDGAVIASNNVALSLVGGSATPGTPDSITVVDGGTITLSANALGNIWGGQFIGAANTTNHVTTQMSFGGATSFQNFQGLVHLDIPSGSIRFFNGGGISGGDAPTFLFSSNSVVVTRDAQTVRLGAIAGGSSSSGIDQATAAGAVDTYIIGGKNIDSTFAGFFRGLNNLVKDGTGTLTFLGATRTENTDGVTFTNITIEPSLVAHTGTTTISNGVLALVVPNNLVSSPVITLASPAAVLDATRMGIVSNYFNDFGAVSVLVTNGVFEVAGGQTLGGLGTIQGSLNATPGSILNVGLPVGTLNVTSGIILDNATVNMDLDRSQSQNSDRLAAGGANLIAVNGGTLTITNLGSDLVTGDVFQLFNKPVAGLGFTLVELPTSNADNSVQYVWENKLAVNGTIKVLQGAAPITGNPTNITFNVSAGSLNLSWPSSHLGWQLQVQTNSLATGLSDNWINVPGSTSSTQHNGTIDAANGAVFYRLVRP
ncbi:MAG TPA: autotransporter-associated beta strand repeat-containing protein [Verrucomicrobiae bacterium]|nr:autotransporter-associated beta strand repeat-containing protein [Verrucomicrobiae bacterium]